MGWGGHRADGQQLLFLLLICLLLWVATVRPVLLIIIPAGGCGGPQRDAAGR